MLKLTKKTFIYLLCILALSSCLSRVEKHGYMFDLSDHHLLKEGISTKDYVLNIMGSPSLVTDLNNEEIWIYYAEDVKKLLFFKPDVIARDIISIKFDNSQTISHLEKYNLDNQIKIDFASNYTKVKSKKDGFFKSIFSNIGQVRPQ